MTGQLELAWDEGAVERLVLSPTLDRATLASLEGTSVGERHFHTVIDRELDVYDGDRNRLVFGLRKGVVPAAAVALAKTIFGSIDEMLPPSYSRQTAAGYLDLERARKVRPDIRAAIPSPTNPFEGYFELESGKRFAVENCNPVRSYFAGYNYHRFRQTVALAGFSQRFPDEWARAIPFFDAIGAAFDEAFPAQTAVMHRWCERTRVKPSFTIGATCLSTVAVNVNYDSCFHYDRGDLPNGFSTLTAMAVGGGYAGGLLVFPRYGVAVDVREGDLLVTQSHMHMHGNTAVEPLDPGAKRLSFVTYLKKMLRPARNLGA